MAVRMCCRALGAAAYSTHRVTAWRWDGKRGRLMSTMPMTASDTRLYGHDTFVAEVVDHLDVLYRVALRLTRRPQDAEDLVQETAARALTRRAQYQPGTNLRAWLLTIERSLFVSAYRHARRGPVTQSLEEVEEGSLYGRGAM